MEVLKKLRKQQKLNQEELAKLLNVTTQAYSRYERGERELGYESLIKLSDYFGVSVDYLIGRPSSKFTAADYANGVTDKARVEVTVEEYEWLELRNEVLRVKGEDYLKTLITMINAVVNEKI